MISPFEMTQARSSGDHGNGEWLSGRKKHQRHSPERGRDATNCLVTEVCGHTQGASWGIVHRVAALCSSGGSQLRDCLVGLTVSWMVSNRVGFGATRQGWSGGSEIADLLKSRLSFSGCESRPVDGSPARRGSKESGDPGESGSLTVSSGDPDVQATNLRCREW
jgi:hypothetical protein